MSIDIDQNAYASKGTLAHVFRKAWFSGKLALKRRLYPSYEIGAPPPSNSYRAGKILGA
jgi:hypothetical protein